jgi:hypothetical protein
VKEKQKQEEYVEMVESELTIRKQWPAPLEFQQSRVL